MYLTPEAEARENIDKLLNAAGWIVQDYKNMNLGASSGVAVREVPTKFGSADYVLFIDRKAIAVIEAKQEGTTLGGASEQVLKYIAGISQNIPHYQIPLPFHYESTGTETFFRDIRDENARSRRVFAFHKPVTLLEWINKKNTLRNRLKDLPELNTSGLWECQIEAITNLEKSFAEGRPRALIQMATGSGKTFTSVSFVYRLIKFAKAKRILFLVDRNNLGRQTLKEFQQYATPDDGRKFTELYIIQHLKSNKLDLSGKVCITTIQRLYSMLKGDPDFDTEIEEESIFNMAMAYDRALQMDVSYNAGIPIETFDFIITDECHRSIYNLWRQVLEYFDAFIIGLTATPSKQTIGFFNKNLVMEYNHERAVADGVNVGYDVYRIKTNITEHGSTIESGHIIDVRDKTTRAIRWEQLDEDYEYTGSKLDRDVVSPDQIRTVIRTFREKIFTEIFPGRTVVPKTLIFAKNDSHAEDIVGIVREEFGKGNEFCKKITYKSLGEKVEDLISSFRNSYNPRIAVTVDMISTGTDIKPLECLIFMRDVRSRTYFEQMKGRGTRTILPDDLQNVTGDAKNKTHFVIIDAVGVCESMKTDSRTLEHKRNLSFDKLVQNIALGIRDEDTITSTANRIARLNKSLNEKDREKIEEAAGGKSLNEIVNNLLDAVDPDIKAEKAKKMFDTGNPDEKQIKQAYESLANEACKPLDNPEFRNTLIEIKRKNEQVIDTVSIDEIISAGYDKDAEEKAKKLIESFRNFIEENRDELSALQIIYSVPYGKRHLTYNEVKELAEAMERPPYRILPEVLWQAYETLEKAKVRKAGPVKLLTNLISLVRFAIGESDFLEPFPEIVNRRFEIWLRQQQETGREFTPEQIEWLKMIKDHIASSISVRKEDFELAPFYEKGGIYKVHQVFGKDLEKILEDLNEFLIKSKMNGII